MANRLTPLFTHRRQPFPKPDRLPTARACRRDHSTGFCRERCPVSMGNGRFPMENGAFPLRKVALLKEKTTLPMSNAASDMEKAVSDMTRVASDMKSAAPAMAKAALDIKNVA